jgi:uncharacterized protein
MLRRIAIAAAALAALAALLGTLSIGDAAAVETTDPGGITVQGTGTASAAPTKAQLGFGVESRADTAKAALAANSAAMRKVIAAVKAAGGDELQTQSVWLSPWQDENGPSGYVATNTVSATIAVGKVGALIDAGVEAGANQVSGPAMTVDDQDELYREALKEAVEQARGHARTLADATGVDLGRVTAVVESGTAVQPPVMMREGLAAADSSTPIEPGKQEVSATVSVTFAIS